MTNLIALIPARGQSKRIPRKNIKRLGQHPLLAYTIEVAEQSCIFDAIYCSTDDLETEAICQHYDCEVIHRPKIFAGDDSPDIEWIQHALSNVPRADYFAILRPTNPFRTPYMLEIAWEKYLSSGADSLRAIEPVSQHPMKMWVPDMAIDGFYEPLVCNVNGEQSWDLPSQVLLPTWVQNGSLQISKTKGVTALNKVTGNRVYGFITRGLEGYDLNTEKDWIYAEWLIANNKVKLIEIDKEPWRGDV